MIYIGEKGGKFSHIAETSGLFDELHYVSAGKLRRYHNEPMLKKLIDIKTFFLNIRDLLRLLSGTLQSIILLRRLKADAALLKGGYVCVPVSIGAKLAKTPTITHDSDALPGLSNRFAARFARFHATAMPAKYYSYPKESIRAVGLPVDPRYQAPSKADRQGLVDKFGINKHAQIVLIIGGSNGARRLNSWCVSMFPELLELYPELHIIHLFGKNNEDQFGQLSPADLKRITLIDFTDELYNYSAIADVVITRAGATTIAEFAAQSKACILVPNPNLSGGHQLKNAAVYEDEQSVLVVQEKELGQSSKQLVSKTKILLDDTALRAKLANSLHKTLPHKPAAKALAELLTEVAKG